MSNQTIAAALATRLSGLSLPTQYENSAFVPVAGQVYIAEALLSGPTLPVGIAVQASDEFGGIYQVTVFAPLGGTKGPAQSTAKRVADHFPRGLTLTRDGIKIVVLRASQGPGFVSGDRYAIPVSINYRALV